MLLEYEVFNKNMDMNVDVKKNELDLKESSFRVKTEEKYEDTSKIDIKPDNLIIEENQNGNLPATYVKNEIGDDNDKLKEEFSSSKEGDTLYEIKTEELILKSESESDNSKTRDQSDGFKDETVDSFGENVNKKHVCDYCDYKTNQNRYLQRHIKLKHDESMMEKYSCYQCYYTTNQKRYLSYHMHKHDKNSGKYGCDHCEYSTHFKSAFERHVLFKHKKNEIKKYSCDHCEYRFHLKSSLKNHVLTKHDKNAIKKISCDQCEYKSHKKGSLERHILLKHDAIKKYGCDHCEHKTNYKYRLKEHVLAKHDKNAIKYNCAQCEYKSHMKLSLKRHVLINHDKNAIKKYGCDHCEYRSHYQCNLKQHMVRKHEMSTSTAVNTATTIIH